MEKESTMSKARLLVISLDAFVYEDVQYARTLPHFAEILDGASVVDKVRSIYPSVTYPCHVTMVSGCYPDRHGIYNNEVDAVCEERPDWYWFARSIKARTLFQAAKEAGYTTAAVSWPVTTCDPAIDINIPELDRFGGFGVNNGTAIEMYEAIGMDERSMRVAKKNIHLMPSWTHPYVDRYFTACMADIIRMYAPEVLFYHDGRPDAARHAYGVFNDGVKKAIEGSDKSLGRIIDALKKAGVYEDTNIVLTADHGQMDIKRLISPNVMFADRGLITLYKNGRVKSWKAYCKCGGMMSQVFLKDPQDQALWQEVYDLLCWMRDEGVYGIGDVFTKEEIKEKEHLDGPFSFVVETDGYTSFFDAPVRPMVRKRDNLDYKRGFATHGYLPEKGPQPTLIMKGPAFKSGVHLKNGKLVDQAPTWARVLSVELPDADGKPISRVLA